MTWNLEGEWKEAAETFEEQWVKVFLNFTAKPQTTYQRNLKLQGKQPNKQTLSREIIFKRETLKQSWQQEREETPLANC